MTEPTKVASIKQVADFFRMDGESLTEFSAQWKRMSDADKEQIKAGVGDGSLTY